MTEATAAPAVPATPVPAAPAAKGDANVNTAPAVPGAKPGETPIEAAKRMLKAKIDGQDVEVDEEAAIRAFQKERASEKRFQEASKMRKQAENFLTMLKASTKDPRVLERIMKDPSIGGDFRQVAESYLYEIIQNEKLSPTERENKELKDKLAQQEAERAEQQRVQQEEQLEKLTVESRENYQKDIIETLDKSDLPRTEYTIAQMARYMLMALQRGKELKASDTVDLVRRDYEKMVGSLLKNLPPDKLASFMGEDGIKKIRDFDLAKVRGGNAGSKKPDATPTAPAGEKPLSREEWRQRIHARANG